MPGSIEGWHITSMRLSLFFKRRTVWLPTFLGILVIFVVGAAPTLFWVLRGEGILAANHAVNHDLLVVEGWILDVPIRAASVEFSHGGYRYVVAAGGYTGAKWYAERWSTAEIVRKNMLQSGVSADKIVFAQAPDTDAHRTYVTAVTVKAVLQAKGITPTSLTVFTLGAHALRSRLVYEKVFGPKVAVGVIAWQPPGTESTRWWRDSDRAVTLLKETCGVIWEWACDSGRGF